MAYEYEGHAGPRLVVPDGATDTHMHIYEPEFAMAPSALLAPPDGKLEDYKKVQKRLGLDRVVIVQPTSYGTDNQCTLEAMEKIGNSAKGVVAIDTSVSDTELNDLTDKGVCGIRFHMLPGGALPWRILPEMAARAANIGWHIQLQLDGRTLPEHFDIVSSLPCTLVIDHVGKFLEPVDINEPSFQMMLRLVDQGAWVKLSAPYETSKLGPPTYDDIGKMAKAFINVAPERMLWASNWPHPGQNPRPDDAILINTLLAWVDTDEMRKMILVDNPAKLYGFN